jgi:tetratricopeptide (TPR) repeat protein
VRTTNSDGPPERGDQPYVGPRSFRLTDGYRFFGREVETESLCTLWKTNRIVLLHGPSAVGKTSLLRAGVIPRLLTDDGVDLVPPGELTTWPAGRTSADAARSELRSTLLRSWAPNLSVGHPLPTIREFISARSQQRNAAGKATKVLAAIDSFDDPLAILAPNGQERDLLIEELSGTLHENADLHLLLVVHDNYLDSFYDDERLHVGTIGYLRLGALNAASGLEAIIAPLERSGKRFEPDAASLLVDKLMTVEYSDQEFGAMTAKHDRIQPLDLQISCARLWSNLPRSIDFITQDHLRLFGQPDRSMAHFYDAAIQDLLERRHHDTPGEDSLRRWIGRSFIAKHGVGNIVRRGRVTTAGMPNLIADGLVERFILVREYHDHAAWYRLSNERLVHAIEWSNAAFRGTDHSSPDSDLSNNSDRDLPKAATVALREGNLDDAQQLISQAIDELRRRERTRGLAYALEVRAAIYNAQGNLAEAEKSLLGALFEFSTLEDVANEARILSTLGNIHSTLGNYVKAIQFHRQASERLPSDADTLTHLGYAQWDWGSPADAEATFTRALSWNRNRSRALAGRGQVRVELREYPAALDDLDRAIKLGLPPESEIDARSARAVAFAYLGREDDATRELQVAQSRDPERSRTRLRAAHVAAAFGRTARARRELNSALLAYPSLPPAEEEMALQLQGRLQGDGS